LEQAPLGLIAGNGTLPRLEARGMRAAGRRVCCVGLAGSFDPQLPRECDAFASAGLIRLGRWIRLMRRWGVREAVMVGGVRKARMYDPLAIARQLPDLRAAMLWYRVLRHDKRDQTVLRAVADELAGEGITLIDTTRYIPEHLADTGVMAGRMTARLEADIAFGWPILMRINALDIGQAIAVKDHDVIAVEAIEGTDATIRRAGELCRSGGWTLLKGPGPEKDMRFDVPTIGVATLDALKAAGARALVVASGRVILADKAQVTRAAERHGITLVGV
jgi:hypothetical protein